MRVCAVCSWPLQASSRVPSSDYCPNDFRDCPRSGRLLAPRGA